MLSFIRRLTHLRELFVESSKTQNLTGQSYKFNHFEISFESILVYISYMRQLQKQRSDFRLETVQKMH